jgi:hypothetical protein
MEDAENGGSECPKILRPVSKQHRLKRCPKNYDWKVGERVVLVAFTGAGMVPTSLYGIFLGFSKCNGRKNAVVRWDDESTLIGGTVAVQRIRPISFIPR